MAGNRSGASSDLAGSGSAPASAVSLLRFGLGAVLALTARFVSFGIEVRYLPALDYSTVAALVAGLVFGRQGVVGAVGASLVAMVLRNGELPDPRFPLADLLVGLIAFELYRRLPRVGRAFPNLRSWGALLLSAVVGGLASASLVAWAMGPRDLGAAIGAWWATVITSTILLAPPAILGLLAIPTVSRARAPIPAEVDAGQLRWLRRGEGHPGVRYYVAAVGPWVLAVAVCAAMVDPGRLSAGTYWISLIYAIPVLWAANEYGLRGGLLVASMVGLSLLVRRPFEADHVAASHEAWMSLQAGALIFAVIAALWGGARESEVRLRSQLAEVNRRLRRELKRTIQALQSAIAAKDAYTEGHLRRVSTYALEVGRSLGVSGRDLELLELASLLHVVGKIGIPERILMKPGVLDGDEVRRMQDHPEIGARILEDVDGLAEAAPLVRYHQERWDGARGGEYPGYPHGLVGEAIPLGARIIAVVDAYDAMTSDRPYRPAKPSSAAIAELRRESGHQFDPAVVEVFVGVLEQRPWRDDSRM